MPDLPQDILTDKPHARRTRDRTAPSSSDIAERMIAFQRKNAGVSRRAERPPTSSTAPTTTQSRPSPSPAPASPRKHHPHPPRDSSPDDFDRRALKARNASPGFGAKLQPRLYNPDADPVVPRLHAPRHRELDHMSEASSSAHQPQHRRAAPGQQHNQPRQLFDPRRDDPVRFNSSNNRPKAPTSTTTGTGGYVSASATSMSDARSMASSAFTLSSVTTTSSMSNPQSPARKDDASGNNAFVTQLKKLYREISALESRLLSEGEILENDDESVRLQGIENATMDRWSRIIAAHKSLAEADHNLLSLALNPKVPASVQSIPHRYNIPTRLWSLAFHRLLSSLRRASLNSPRALEHLTDFIYYAYGFYTGLYEEVNLSVFKGMWIEALGDLASYRMAVAVTTPQSAAFASASKDSAPQLRLRPASPSRPQKPLTEARIDESPTPSIGVHAAAELEDDERATWKHTAQGWYYEGLKETPGTGRLHHYLGQLSKDERGEELRTIYHFVKSLIASHPSDNARESILSFFAPSMYQKLSQPSAPGTSLFLLLHGMIFGRIDLDSFQATLARFTERLQLDHGAVDESEWIMMGVVNVGAMLQYGKADSLLRKAGALGSPSPMAGKAAKSAHGRAPERDSSLSAMDQDDAHASRHGGPIGDSMPVAEPESYEDEDENDVNQLSRPMQALSTGVDSPTQTQDELVFHLALELTFAMLSHVLQNPMLPPKNTVTKPALNPYLTIVLTFLGTLFRHPPALALIEKHVPWTELAAFTTEHHDKGKSKSKRPSTRDQSSKLISDGPLPEDWCMRGMEWVGRRVYERGFWKLHGGGNSDPQGESLALTSSAGTEQVDGIVEDDSDGMDVDQVHEPTDDSARRWKRLRYSADSLAKSVPGLASAGGMALVIGGELQEKVVRWTAERQAKEEAERRRHARTSWDEEGMDMEVDEIEDEEDVDDIHDSEVVRALKARRRYLRSLLTQTRTPDRATRHRRVARPRHRAPERPPLRVVPGYTVLVVDTNILLSSLSMVVSLVESRRWTVVVPLAVIHELDGLASNPPPLGKAAADALAYLTTNVPAHSTSLKVQTSKGNYLMTLSVRHEQIDFRGDAGVMDRNMDDLILRSAVWQAEHFMDRSALLKGRSDDEGPLTPLAPTPGTAKVVLLSFDRNLRLKARARDLDAADEKDMASILAAGT